LRAITLNLVINAFVTFIFILVAIAFVILGERKLLGAIQRREGPNLVGWFGLLQSFVDGFKLILKENILPYRSNKIIFFFSSFTIFLVSLLSWVLIPTGFYSEIIDSDFAVFLIFIFSLINVYFIILAGWASNSKYAFIGSLRSTAQMISYEIYFGLTLLPIFFFTGSTNLNDIIFMQKNLWFIFLYYPLFILFFISTLA
jgi:NADH-quinone oxidoreductase subunit H